MPLVSVVVTTFNRKEFLVETLKSILSQSFQDFELIVVDNFSNYDFFTLIQALGDTRIRAYQNYNEGIIAVNRNVGIKKAKGKYLAFCDDDDMWLPEKLEKQLQFIIDNKIEFENNVLYTNCINFSENIEVKTNKKEIRTINDLIESNEITYSSVLISNNEKSTFFFNESPEFMAVEDYIYWCTLKANKYRFYLLPDYLVRYRILKTSASNINYGLNHLRRVYALSYVVIKFREFVRVNYLIFVFTVLKEILKFGIKKLFKNSVL